MNHWGNQPSGSYPSPPSPQQLSGPGLGDLQETTNEAFLSTRLFDYDEGLGAEPVSTSAAALI